MRLNNEEIKRHIESASPLDLPNVLMEIELFEQETAIELFDKINDEFIREDIIDNVVTPVFYTMIDGLLEHPKFEGIVSKSGLSAGRVMKECKEFNYDGKIVNMMPDSFVEHQNETRAEELWGHDNRSKYIREAYHNPSEMNRYKLKKVEENGTKKNMMDEYTNIFNITPKKNYPDLRRKDIKNNYNGETDHIIPLKTLFNQLKNNSAVSNGDIKRIANKDYNFAITARMINNAKRDWSNTEFIALQDRLKKEGKPYVELSPEVRANMIKMEKEAQKAINNSVNKTVVRNLLNKGLADRKDRKAAMEAREKQLGRKLTRKEKDAVDKELAKKKARDIHLGNAAQAGKQSLMYALGTTFLFVLKPLYYEIKDGFINGFKEGVCAETAQQAISIRFGRVKKYVWRQIKELKNLLDFGLEILKDFLSALIEGIIGMFVGILKQIFKVLKEGVKIFIQSWPVLFGEQSQKMNINQKGDAILKIVAGSVIAFCGIGVESFLANANIPEDYRSLVSVLLRGLLSVFVFYALDKADLFGVKKEYRDKRIKEIFDERIKDIKEATEIMSTTVLETIKKQKIEFRDIMMQFTNAINDSDYNTANNMLIRLSRFLNISLGYDNQKEFSQVRNNLNWDL